MVSQTPTTPVGDIADVASAPRGARAAVRRQLGRMPRPPSLPVNLLGA